MTGNCPLNIYITSAPKIYYERHKNFYYSVRSALNSIKSAYNSIKENYEFKMKLKKGIDPDLELIEFMQKDCPED